MFRVMKGQTKARGILDSTHASISDANKRRDALRKSYRGGKDEHGQRIVVWVEEATDNDPVDYRRPKKGPWHHKQEAKKKGR
jgi:hypothetical protein